MSLKSTSRLVPLICRCNPVFASDQVKVPKSAECCSLVVMYENRLPLLSGHEQYVMLILHTLVRHTTQSYSTAL